MGLTMDSKTGSVGRPAAPDALPVDVDTVSRALDAWLDLGVGHVQVDLRPVDERTIGVLVAARNKHRGEG